MPDIDENQLMWLEDEDEGEPERQAQVSFQATQLDPKGHATESNSAAITALEEELQRTRKELMDVRKELAAKTVQLSRKEVVVAQEKVAELAAHVSSEKDKQLSSLAAHVEHLEMMLSQKEEELEESRRMYTAQKRALREALAAAAEAEAAERQADEASARTAVAQVVEDELDRLQHELALLQARYNLEMRARDAEVQSLRSELQAANANRKQAVAAAEAALTEAWQNEVVRATEEAQARVTQLEAEVARVRQQMEDQARSADTMALAGELASLNQQKVAIQREFDAFRDMATAAARQNRETAARLLEENASLKSRLAAKAFQDVQAGFKPQSKVFTALKTPGGHLGSASGSGALGSDVGESGGAWLEQLPAVLARLERQRKGLVPALVLGGMVALFVLVAVIRAAAVTRSEHRGGLCFLAHLGINVGTGCGPNLHPHTVSEVAVEEMGHLLETAPRVHDIEAVAAEGVALAESGDGGIESTTKTTVEGGATAAAAGATVVEPVQKTADAQQAAENRALVAKADGVTESSAVASGAAVTASGNAAGGQAQVAEQQGGPKTTTGSALGQAGTTVAMVNVHVDAAGKVGTTSKVRRSAQELRSRTSSRRSRRAMLSSGTHRGAR